MLKTLPNVKKFTQLPKNKGKKTVVDLMQDSFIPKKVKPKELNPLDANKTLVVNADKKNWSLSKEGTSLPKTGLYQKGYHQKLK